MTGTYWLWAGHDPEDFYRYGLIPLAKLSGFACILAVPVVVFVIRLARRPSRSQRRAAMGLCVACGYSLKGNTSGVCPECGAPVRFQDRRVPHAVFDPEAQTRMENTECAEEDRG